MKYIFVTGAPGSKWSSVVKNIYYSPSIDRSDYSDERTYYHDASGTMQLMHLGAYFDPGMEFGNFFDKIEQYSKEDCEAEFDRPFNGKGIRIIKSHVFADKIDFLKKHWPECPIVLVHRSDDSCLGWWVKCGHFNITYPKYDQYYVDLKHMAKIIASQNESIMKAWHGKISNYTNDGVTIIPGGNIVINNRQLSSGLKIDFPPLEYFQDYNVSDLKVKII